MPVLRRLLPYLAGILACVVFQLGWTLYTRMQGSRRLERVVREHAEMRETQNFVPTGTELRIPWFYANAGTVVRGQQVVLCYGVENAVNVRIDPPVEELKPAYNRCFAVVPRRNTTYTLVAEGKTGETRSASLAIDVAPPPPTILFLTASQKEISHGAPWTFCYGVRNAVSVQMEPLGLKLTPSERRCAQIFPLQSTVFTLTAFDELGRKESEKVELVVR